MGMSAGLSDPVPHGPFAVAADGALHVTRAPALRFAWRGRACRARLEDGAMRLSASVGRIPFTADRPARRAATLVELAALPAALPPGWRLRVGPDHRLLLDAAHPLATPTTATALVAAMVGFALALDPYLDRLDSAGLDEVGSAKT